MLQKIKGDNKERIETGGLQINDDWPGLFIRGDGVLHLFSIYTMMKDGEPNLKEMALIRFKSLLETVADEVIQGDEKLKKDFREML